MIVSLSNKEITELSAVSPFLTRIRGNAEAFGNLDCARLQNYYQCESGSVLQSCFGGFTVFANEGADISEIDELLSFCGFNTVFSNSVYAKASAFSVLQQGVVMKHSRQCFADNGNGEEFSRLYYPQSSELFEFLNRNGIEDLQYDAFCLQLIYPLNSGKTRAFANSAKSSVAITGWEDNKGAVISAVATDKSLRKQGLGTAAVCALVNELIKSGKTDIYLCRENGKNEEFYKNCGFINSGEFFVLTH